jgi:hypothetical protein
MIINVTGSKTGKITILRDPKPVDNSIRLVDILEQLRIEFPGNRYKYVDGELVPYPVREPVFVDGKRIEDPFFQVVLDNPIEIKSGLNVFKLEIEK